MNTPSAPSLQVDAPPLPLSAGHWRAICSALRLSPKQTQVVELVLRGLCDKQIAQAMGISEATVRTYLDRISARTRTKGRMELAMKILAISHQVFPATAVLEIDDREARTR